jgi:hypothetical protein
LNGRPEGKTLRGKPKHRWKDIIRMYLRAVEWEDVDWMHLVYDRNQQQALVNTAVDLQVLLKAGNFLTTDQLVIMTKINAQNQH